MNALLVAVAYITTGSLYMSSLPLVFFDSELQLPLLGLLACIEIVFYVIIPRFVWNGQTLGKKLLHMRILPLHGERVGLARLAIRDLIGVVLIEGCFSPLSNYVRNYFMLFVSRDIIQYSVWFSWVMGAASVLVLLVTKRQMLHDVFAGTRVAATPAAHQVHDKEASKVEEAAACGSGVEAYPHDELG